MAVGSALALLRQIPEKILEVFINQVTMLVTCVDTDSAFLWIKEWLLQHPVSQRSRRVDLDTDTRGEASPGLSLSPGNHFFMYQGRPIWLNFTRTEEKKLSNMRRSESFRIRTIGRNQKFLKDFLNDLQKAYKDSHNKSPRMAVFEDGWLLSGPEQFTPRPLDTVIWPGTEKENLLSALKKFLANEQRYKSLGIPWHFGVMLEGLPGTGKTSAAAGFAHELNRHLYVLSLAEITSDSQLRDAIRWIPKNAILLFEDIDAMGVGKKRKDKKEGEEEKEESKDKKELFTVTLSGLLNSLDGLSAPEGVIYFMTSNHSGNLDPALLRPGRVDYRVHLGYATFEQKFEMYNRFFGPKEAQDNIGLLKLRPDETMAEFQGYLLAKMEHEL